MKRRDALRWLGTSSGLVILSACGGGDDAGNLADAADNTDALVLPDGGICRATSNDVLGPFHRDGAPSRMMIASATEPGDRIALDGVVLADDCATPLVGAALDIWQSDAAGAYHEPNAGEPFRLRGKVAAAADGTWMIDTIKPGNYRLGASGWRPAHIHFIVTHPGYRPMTTQLYFAGDPYLPPNDACTSCGSDDPARVIPLVARAGGGFTAQFQIVLARA